MKTFVISGGFGDSINQISKAIYSRNSNEQDKIIYVRDTVDEQLLNQINPLTRTYVDWVKDICVKNNFLFETVTEDQKKFYEKIHSEYPDYILLGPNVNYDLKIWEEQRKLNVGFRPFETLIDIKEFPINFVYDDQNLGDNNICIQVRFGSEYPSKIPNACWKDVQQLVSVIKLLKEKGYTVSLVGETKQRIEKLSEITNYYINQPASLAYNVILSSKYCIGFSGFFANLALNSCKKTLRMHWDPAEKHLQTHTLVQSYCTDLHANNDITEQTNNWLQQL